MSIKDLPEPEDIINNPRHYTSHPSGVEQIQITEHMSYNIGTAMAYLWRHEYKNGVQDLEKAIWHINREIQKLNKGK